jgi:hypothetical protein
LTAPVRALLTVAGDELRKDGGNEANRVLRADRTEQPKGWASNLGIRCAVSSTANFVRRKTMQLASRFANHSPALRSDSPLSDDQIRRVAPSIFAEAPHASRSERYSYIPTATVLQELRGEGFQPFMVCQTRVRNEGRREHTKHMLRLRHANQINAREANEIILLNSHDGTSSYQLLGGMYRFVCQNGLVCGDTVADVRVPHKGDVAGQVIEGAYQVLGGFDRAQESREAMQAVTLDAGESEVFARAALALKYDDPDKPAPVTESQILMPRRFDDRRPDLWAVFNRTQENLTKGGLSGRAANGRRQQTRPVQGIDTDIRLNRALWLLADGMRQLKA